MSELLTVSQRQRLVELNAAPDQLDCEFTGVADRDAYYKQKEAELSKGNREKLLTLVNEIHRPLVLRIESDLISWLADREGFTQVVTPIIISEKALDKMTITAEHPLTNQVFWLEGKKCLRPMLAPNLYELMGDLHKVLRQPVKIFESGPCFRKETQGAQHMNEFTMLNLVELGATPEGGQMERLKQLAYDAMKAIGLADYTLEITESEVYGETLDIVAAGIELASGAFGPHPLDARWGIFDTWVGIGFGLERLAMAKAGYQNIKRSGRSLSYLDGARLNL
jgi:phenylalanyl-tRNA synthetase alpha chain